MVTPQTEHEQCQNERHLSSYASTENQNGLFHTHKFNPKMLCHCRELEGGWGRGERHKKQKTRLRAAPSNIEVEQVQIGITQHLLVIVSTTWSVLSKTRHKHATHTSNHTTYQYHYHISLLLILIKGFLISFYYFLILLIKLQYSALAWKLYPLYISAYGASTRSFPFFVIFFELAEKAD